MSRQIQRFNRCSSVGTQCNMEFAEYSGQIRFPSSCSLSEEKSTVKTTDQSETQQNLEPVNYEPMSSDVDIQSFCDRSSDLDFVMSEDDEFCDDCSEDGIYR